MQVDVRLRERCFGRDSQTHSELPKLYPAEYALWCSRDPDLHSFPAKPDEPNNRGESIREFHQRVISCLHDYAAERYAGQRIALIAHGGVLEYCVARGIWTSTPMPSAR